MAFLLVPPGQNPFTVRCKNPARTVSQRPRHFTRPGRAYQTCSCAAGSSDPLLLRVARGEQAERTPVWLMRQAGRYMAEFREYSDRLMFRQRSETADIALELSLQPWRAFQPDGVIMFSDILTPLPALGIEFDVIRNKGPKIDEPIRSMEQVAYLTPLDDPDSSLPFIREILTGLRSEVGNAGTVLGFIGAPWTLAAYAMEGGASKTISKTKSIMWRAPEVAHALLSHITDAMIVYVCHQIDCGAQVVQLFDSWAHHLTPQQYTEFSLPYALRVVEGVKSKYPDTPLIFHANGGTGKLEFLGAMSSAADVIGLDHHVDMAIARRTLGEDVRVQGNVDPIVLLGTEETIRSAVTQCLQQAGPRGHILNVGHGVDKQTPEENVKLFCDLARESASLFDRDAARPMVAA